MKREWKRKWKRIVSLATLLILLPTQLTAQANLLINNDLISATTTADPFRAMYDSDLLVAEELIKAELLIDMELTHDFGRDSEEVMPALNDDLAPEANNIDKELAKAEKEAQKAREEAEKEAQKAQEKTEKEAQKAQEKDEKEVQKTQEKALKDELKALEKAEREAERAREKAEMEVQKAAEKAEKEARKQQRKAEKEKRMQEKEAELKDQHQQDRYIVKYKSSRSKSIETLYAGADIQSAEIAGPEGERIELITLSEKVNPQTFALDLKASGAEKEIIFIQPDFALSLASLSLELLGAEAGRGDDVYGGPEDDANAERNEENDGTGDSDENGSEKPEESEDFDEDEAEEIDEIDEADEKEAEALPEIENDLPVLIAVIDTGADNFHPMLAPYLVEGYNFTNNSNITYDPDTPLTASHSTHIAGIIAGIAAETGANIEIMPLQVFDNGVAYTSHILEAIQYAKDHGATIINMSFGSADENPALYELIKNTDALFISAAGNHRRDLAMMPSYPASYQLNNLISVAATNADGGFSYFSNFGPKVLDVTALGRDVLSSLPGGAVGTMTGTSMSAAYVSGVAAVVMAAVLAEEDTISIQALKERLLSASDQLENLKNKVDSGRRINLHNALAGTSGSHLNLNPTDDFDVHGYDPSESESWELYSAAGKVVQAAAGGFHSLVLKSDGSVWSFGANFSGQLGNGTFTSSRIPVRVIGLYNIVAISSSGSHNLALGYDGTLWVWGANGCGQLGDGTTTYRTTPVQVKGLEGVTAISAGSEHSLALTSDGKILAWGSNHQGQLGDGTNVSHRTSPYQITVGGTNVVKVAAGAYHNVAIGSDGLAWSWGRLGSAIERYPKQLSYNMSTIKELSAGNDISLAVSIDGSALFWGSDSLTPTLNSYLTNVKSVSGGGYSLIQKQDQTVWSFGATNNCGQLGIGTNIGSVNPVKISELSNITAISAGLYHSLAVKSDGSLFSWGNNSEGQLGDGTTTDQWWPVQVGISNEPYQKPDQLLAAGGSHSLMIDKNKKVWAWGANDYGQLGDGTTTEKYFPVQVNGLSDVKAITAGFYHSLALKEDGTIWAFGGNLYGQLGDGTTTHRSSPVQVKNITNAVAIATGGNYNFAITSDGKLWAWGENWGGQLGDGTRIQRTTPVQIDGLTDIVAVSGGWDGYSIAVRADGKTFAWGDWNDGNHNTPVPVGNLPYIVDVSVGCYFYLALAGSKSAFAWGRNSHGQLGDYSTIHRGIPVGVWDVYNIATVSAGYDHSLALDTNGYVHAWGSNWVGQLGDGTQTWDRWKTTPLPVVGLEDIVSISAGDGHNLAMDKHGRVWAWGNNWEGQIGDGTTTHRLAPVCVLVPNGMDMDIEIKNDTTYTLSINAVEISNLNNKTFSLSYDPAEMQLLDFAAHIGSNRTTNGLIPGTPITIISHTNGEVVFSYNKAVPGGYEWTGVLTIVKFKAIKNGVTRLRSEAN